MIKTTSVINFTRQFLMTQVLLCLYTVYNEYDINIAVKFGTNITVAILMFRCCSVANVQDCTKH